MNARVLILAFAVLAAATPAKAQPAMQFGGVIQNAGNPYTLARETQGKVFFVDGTWWGVFGSATGLDFWQFNAGSRSWSKSTFSGSHLTDDSSSRADCIWDGANVCILYSVGASSGVGQLWLAVYGYTKPTFTRFPGFPAQVVASGAVDKNWSIVEDTNLRLWMSYQTTSQYGVISTRGTGPSSWSMFNPTIFMGNASSGIDGDLGSHGLCTFGGKVGLMWTECFSPPSNHTKFRWRSDSSSDFTAGAWGAEELCQEDATFTRLTDDHVCVRGYQGQVWGISKTNYDVSDQGLPRFTLMRRDTSGHWSHWVAKSINPAPDYSTRPIMVIDATNNVIYCLWHNNGVEYNTTPIASPGTFSSVKTMILESGTDCCWDTSSANAPCTAASGMMIIADRNCDGWTLFNDFSLGTVTVGPLATITVTPNPAATMTGGSVTFTATGQDANGNTVSFTPTWSATGGTITSSGVYTAGSAGGTFTVTASSGSVSGSATVNVTAPTVTSITVSPNPASVTTGGTVSFAARAKDQNGNPMSGVSFVWSATGGTITQAGVYTAGSQTGTFSVTASSGSVSGSATVNVTQAQQPPTLTTITVTPNPASVVAGGTVTFSAQAKDQNGNNMSGITFTWSATGGTITQAGVYTAGSQTGPFAVTAASGSVSGSATVNVTSSGGGNVDVIVDNDTPGWAVISGTWALHFTPLHYGPSNRALDTGSGTARWTPSIPAGTYDVLAWWPERVGVVAQATATYTIQTTDGPASVVVNQMTQPPGQWNKVGTFSLGANALIQVSGSAGVAADAVRFTSSGSGPTQTLTAISVTPNPANLTTGARQTFTAQGTDQNGQPMAVSVTWSATGGSIDQGGNYTAGQTAGAFSVTATSGSVSGSATVNLTQAQNQILTTIVVSPNPASTTPGGTVSFSAQAKDQNGSNMSATFMWGASSGTIDQTGKYTAPAATGSFDVSASSQGIVGHATVNVTAAMATITVDDSDPGWSVLSGTWNVHYNPNRFGPTDHLSASVGVCQWNPQIATSGTYDVYVWVPTTYNIGPSQLASYTVTTANGSVNVTLDQNQSGIWGTWVKLGSYALNGSAVLQLAASSGQTVAADAAKFVMTGP